MNSIELWTTNKGWIEDIRSIPVDKWTETVREQILAVFTDGKNDDIYAHTVPKKCDENKLLYITRYIGTLEMCTSKSLEDKSIEKMLWALNCFWLQEVFNSYDNIRSVKDMTQLKLSVLLWDYDMIYNLIEKKINLINSQDELNEKNLQHALEVWLIVSVCAELFSICSTNPYKKDKIKECVDNIFKLCDAKFEAISANISSYSKWRSQEFSLIKSHILSTLQYCYVLHFSWFSTNPNQKEDDVVKNYTTEKEFLNTLGNLIVDYQKNNDKEKKEKWLRNNKNDDKLGLAEKLAEFYDLSPDKYNRNKAFLSSYLELLFIQYKKRSCFQLNKSLSKDTSDIKELIKEEQKALTLLFHSYPQVAWYQSWDPELNAIDEKITLLTAQGWVKINWVNEGFDKLNSTMLVVDEIFKNFLYNLENDHYAIWELFLVINAIIQFVDFENEEKILNFQNKIDDILMRKNMLNIWYQYPQWSFNLWHLWWKTAWYIKNFAKMLQELSTTCAMTWLSNRFSFDLQLQNVLLQVIRESVNNKSESNKWLISLDIDHFKDINDTYGHDVWDKVLKTFAKVVSNTKRQTDWFYRTWWEEFMILCECDTQEWAKAFWLKLLSAVENEVIKCIPDVNKDGEIKPKNPVTMSVGMVQIENDWGYTQENLAEFSDHVLKTVDCHLYNVKESWRNGLGIWGEYYSREELSKHLWELGIWESHLELIQKI